MKGENLTIPFRWLGSKVRIRKNILGIIDGVPRSLYVEPFGGAGALFFAKEPEPSVYNDRNVLAANFFEELKKEESRRAFKKMAEKTEVDSTTFYAFRDVLKLFHKGTVNQTIFPEYSRNTALAFTFFFVQNFAFSSVPNGPWGGVELLKTYERNLDRLDAFAAKFEQTKTTAFDFSVCMKLCDNEKTLFYIDPPYIGTSSKNYARGGGPVWNDNETRRLVEYVKTLKGNVVLSCYDDEIYHPLLKAGFQRQNFKAYTSCARKKEGRAPRVECVYFKVKK